MSQLNVYRGTFLEKEELMNFQDFMQNSLIKNLLLNATYTFGLVSNNPAKFDPSFKPSKEFKANDPFLVEIGSSAGTYKVSPGVAFNSNGELIVINKTQDNLIIPQDDLFYWVKISYTTRNYELGTVSVNQKGNVTGTVDFSNKVRGQAGATPVSIRFEKEDGSQPLNNGIYQIVSVIDNKNLVLTSTAQFTNESGLRVVILGTIPLNSVFSNEQLAGLYTYDYFTISLVKEVEAPGTAPNKDANEFYISRIRNSGGVVTIDNSVKTEYWSLAGFMKGGQQ